ncbi:MAG: hypothetical protein EZS28_008293 [Streblomastix strix]|uniref:Uncharacterized protein n=1 Tax=Streblomastix strix TaxID=222440 RepID=A0A5J4WMG3_9EUKA|nr:MAG: hypothetical protein EZS28_008293 [Streblomastix strix]
MIEDLLRNLSYAVAPSVAFNEDHAKTLAVFADREPQTQQPLRLIKPKISRNNIERYTQLTAKLQLNQQPLSNAGVLKVLCAYSGSVEGEKIKYNEEIERYSVFDKVEVSNSQRVLINQILLLGSLHKLLRKLLDYKRTDPSAGLIEKQFVSAVEEELYGINQLAASLERELLKEKYEAEIMNQQQIQQYQQFDQDGEDRRDDGSVSSYPTASSRPTSVKPFTAPNSARNINANTQIMPFSSAKLSALINVVVQCKGGQLLSELHRQLKSLSPPPLQLLLSRLLSKTCIPFFAFVQKWIENGEIEDQYHEFFVMKCESFGLQYKLAKRDLREKDKEKDKDKDRQKDKYDNKYMKQSIIDGERGQVNNLMNNERKMVFEKRNQIQLISTNADKRLKDYMINNTNLMKDLEALKGFMLLSQAWFVDSLMSQLWGEINDPKNNIAVGIPSTHLSVPSIAIQQQQQQLQQLQQGMKQQSFTTSQQSLPQKQPFNAKLQLVQRGLTHKQLTELLSSYFAVGASGRGWHSLGNRSEELPSGLDAKIGVPANVISMGNDRILKPVDTIITDVMMEKYQFCFDYFWSLKRARFVLKKIGMKINDLWRLLKTDLKGTHNLQEPSSLYEQIKDIFTLIIEFDDVFCLTYLASQGQLIRQQRANAEIEEQRREREKEEKRKEKELRRRSPSPSRQQQQSSQSPPYQSNGQSPPPSHIRRLPPIINNNNTDKGNVIRPLLSTPPVPYKSQNQLNSTLNSNQGNQLPVIPEKFAISNHIYQTIVSISTRFNDAENELRRSANSKLNDQRYVPKLIPSFLRLSEGAPLMAAEERRDKLEDFRKKEK